MYQASSHCQS